MRATFDILKIALVSSFVWVLLYNYFPVSIFDTIRFGSSITTLDGADTLKDSRTDINDNFDALNTDKLESGSTATSLTVSGSFFANEIEEIGAGSLSLLVDDGVSASLSLSGSGATLFGDASGVFLQSGSAIYSFSSLSGGAEALISATGLTSTQKTFSLPNLNGTFLVGSTTLANGNIGIGTTSPRSLLHVSKGATGTTTINVGDFGSATSDACFNTKNIAGSDISFYFVGTTLTVENNACR